MGSEESRAPAPERVPLLANQWISSDADQDGDQQSREHDASSSYSLNASKARAGASEEPLLTRKELWSYYLYYNGNNGVGPGLFSQALLQEALTHAGSDPASAAAQPGTCSASTHGCMLSWWWPGIGRVSRSVTSVVLLANGTCFAIMTVLFVALGAAADHGSFGSGLLLAMTLLCWTLQFAMAGLTNAEHWHLAVMLYICSYVTYGATLVFYASIFPRLARAMPHVRRAKAEVQAGSVTQAAYDQVESMKCNHVSSVSTAHSNIGYVATLLLSLAVLIPMHNHPASKNIALCLTTVYWIALGIPWFINQQARPGPSLPKGESYLTIGWTQVYHALLEMRHLPQTFTYLIAYFLLADGINTTGSLIGLIQNDQVSFSFTSLALLGLTQAICSVFSTMAFWRVQQAFQIRTKTMLLITVVFAILIPAYGVLGLFWPNSRAGYHSLTDFYLYNIAFGLFQAPYYAYAQTMMAEVTPKGRESMFFGLFGITNRASSILGPNLIQLVISRTSTSNNWAGFPVLMALCGAAGIVLSRVDVERAREDCRRYCGERVQRNMGDGG